MGVVVWVALAAASIGVVADLFEHWVSSPWSRYSLLFVPLSVWALRPAPGRDDSARIGTALVALGAVAQVLAIGGGFERYGRLGLAVALVGMACLQGLPGWTRRLSLVWLIPLPHLAVTTLGEPLLGLWEALGARIAGGVDSHSVWADPALWQAVAPGLGLDGLAGGVCCAAVLAGCGWMASARAGAPLSEAVARSACWGLLGIPLHAGCVILAALALTSTALPAETVAAALGNATWLLAAAVGLALCWARRNRHVEDGA